MAEFYTRFIKETFDENGRLTACSYVYDENFNYGYDVIDPLGTLCPDRRGHQAAADNLSRLQPVQQVRQRHLLPA